ncbi:WGR domain-containing protein [Microvirga roseola]|uniref:WGR domain-containing protein n=1 Tax=Microvirga roseola TaxID=2883126 RepID=UPI001E3A3559|nr:WGR domain-containing protein [Microvirga roseola]
MFGTVRLVRNWGPVGVKGQEKVDTFPDEAEAARALEAWATTQRKKGYSDL